MTATPPGLYDIAGRFDPEATNWVNRGIKVYDAGREPTEADVRLLTEWRASHKPEQRPGGGRFIYVGPNPGDFRRCVCGGCLFSLDCGGAP